LPWFKNKADGDIHNSLDDYQLDYRGTADSRIRKELPRGNDNKTVQ
jgi:hypothetical protein